jgi:ABC-type transport system involved in cytochrome c biogenesis permease subunit
VLFIIPPGKDATKPEWLSPWQLLNGQPLTEKNRAYLDTLQQLVSAIYVGDSVAAKIAIDTFKAQVGVTRAMGLEVRFNRANWFNYSMFLYLLACFSVLLGFQFKHKAFWICSFLFLIVGCGMHSTGIIQRMIIMQRPPVTTLYESILFVGWAVVILATFVEFFMRNGVALFVASIAGASLNMLSKQYAVDGDTMGMLVAVLNSNFWLGTHVVSITFGYGCTLLVGIFAHAYLFLRVFKPSDKLLLNNTYKNTVGLTFIALFFTTLGTILGGIWGDQSWGRFWGWDPKENGAMLIVLWLLMLVHGRVSGILREVGYCAGMIVANVVVMVAWFGVNLLGVGLHSYGFDKGAATNLFIFAAVEVAIAVGLGVVCKLRPLPK